MNRELIRRDFKFGSPVFVDDPKSESPKHESEIDEEEEGKIEQATEETISLAKYLRESPMEYPGEKTEVGETAGSSPEEWAKEYEKVKNKFSEEEKLDPGHYLTHIIKMQRYAKRVKGIMDKHGHATLQNYLYICEHALDEIKKLEKRLNNKANKEMIDEMTATSSKRIEIAKELIELRNKVKEQIDQFDYVLEEYNTVSVLFSISLNQRNNHYNQIGTTCSKVR